LALVLGQPNSSCKPPKSDGEDWHNVYRQDYVGQRSVSGDEFAAGRITAPDEYRLEDQTRQKKPLEHAALLRNGYRSIIFRIRRNFWTYSRKIQILNIKTKINIGRNSLHLVIDNGSQILIPALLPQKEV